MTAITKSGKTISFVKGATFLTSHQSLAGYATETWVKGLKYITDADAAAKYQPKGNYLTSHQSLDGYVNAVTTTGTGNAVTGITKSGKTVIATKGATFLTSHQDISGKSDKSHTHSVKINGVTKTIAATGGTPVDLGNYLTTHQSLAGYAKTSQIPTKVSQLTNDSGFLTSHQSLAGYATETWVKGLKYITDADAAAKYQPKGNYLTSHQSLAGYMKTVDADKKYLGKTEKAASASTADNAAKVNNHTVNANVPSNAKFTDTEYVIPTLSSAPTSSTLTFTDNGATRSFKVGYMCRVADSSAEHGYKFYQLYNISNGKATWGEISGGDYYETVTVTLKSHLSSSDSKLNGVIVTVKNTMTNETQTQTWKGMPLVFKIPTVNTYTVSVSGVSGYATPPEQSYTAGVGTSRNVIMTYGKLPLGIYIYDTDGHFTLPKNWNAANNSKAVGVYVGTENSNFVISPTYDKTNKLWGGEGTTISGIVTAIDKTTAKKDYAGEANTDKIIAQLGTGNFTAAEYCRNYTFKNGKKGYLWSMGEACDANNNIDAIISAMIKIGGTEISADDYHWTSTQYNGYYAWMMLWGDKEIQKNGKDNAYFARPVCGF